MPLYIGSKLVSQKINTGDKVESPLYNLFDFKWTDHLLTDPSWINANDFEWIDGTIYINAFNELFNEYQNTSSTDETEDTISYKHTPKGFKIALNDQETAISTKYNDKGLAWYYILDITNKKFKLPRTKWGFEGLRDSVGKDIEESLPNIKGNTGNVTENLNGTGVFSSIESFSPAWNNSLNSRILTFDASRYSSTYQDNAKVQEYATQMYLYFYVTDSVRTELNTDLSDFINQTKAGLDNAVTLDTAQTISAQKIVTSEWLRQSQEADITADITLADNTSTMFLDKTGRVMGALVNYQNIAGCTSELYAQNQVGYQAKIGAFVPKDGRSGAYGYAPTPPISSDSTEITTAAWARANGVGANNCITYIPEIFKITVDKNAKSIRFDNSSTWKVYTGTGIFKTGRLAKTLSYSSLIAGQYIIFMNEDANIECCPIDDMLAGADVSIPTSGDSLFYDWTNRVVHRVVDGTDTGLVSLPLAVFSKNDNGVVNFDHIFTGIGFIGEAYFCIPGIKCAYPNGRDKGGKAVSGEWEWTGTAPLTNTYTTDAGYMDLAVGPQGIAIGTSTTKGYNIADNKYYQNGTQVYQTIIGEVFYDKTKKRFTTFNIAYPFEQYTSVPITTDSGSGVPTGTIIAWSTATAPEGYLICDGSAISRTTYANLFAVIGTLYGSGDGNSTFNLPDANGKSIFQDAAGSVSNGGLGSVPNVTAGKATSQNTLGVPANALNDGIFGAMKVVGHSDENNRFQIGGLAGYLKRAILDASLESDCYVAGADRITPAAIHIKFAIKY